jgi:pyridoxine kinase
MSDITPALHLENPRQKRILLINDLSCFGKCSLTVSLPVFAACGIEAVPLPTALLSTHTGGFPLPYILPLGEQMDAIATHWQQIGLRFDAIYSGYLCGEEQIEVVERIFDRFADENTLCVVDPVMGDGGKLYHGFDLSFAARMRHLCTRADIITPNATEAALLTGCDVADMTDTATQRRVLAALSTLGPRAVALTGAVRADGTVGYLCCEGERVFDDIRHRHYDRPLHGCGDVFASALCCALLRGKATEQAVRIAADFTLHCIEQTVGDAPAHWYGLRYEAGLSYLMAQLSE